VALSNSQLLMLDNLIYTDYCDNGDTVRQIINEMKRDLDNGKSIEGCMMTNDEWREIIAAVEGEPSLLDYTVQNYENNTDTGMRAACFVDDVNQPTDVNVVFRGTSGDYEWHDNGEGGYLADTDQQKAAADYVNNLPEEYGNGITVTGHSKGGNKAQYVTIVTDRIARCVSYDGQGFSEEFLEKYGDRIAERADRIESISAADDYVNCLLYSIAGIKTYILTEEQGDFLHYHKPNILLDENGDLRPAGDQSPLSQFINEYTTYIISNVPEPQRSVTIDGLIALLEEGEDKETIWQTIYAGGTAISYLDNFAFDYFARLIFGPKGGVQLTRDFSDESKRRMLGLVTQVESEKWGDFTDWVGDRWYDFESWIGTLNIRHYLNDVNTYHKKVIDKNMQQNRKSLRFSKLFVGSMLPIVLRSAISHLTWLSGVGLLIPSLISLNPAREDSTVSTYLGNSTKCLRIYLLQTSREFGTPWCSRLMENLFLMKIFSWSTSKRALDK